MSVAVDTEPALTRSDLISELAASRPHLRVMDVELIVATICNQITAALARGVRAGGRDRDGAARPARRPLARRIDRARGADDVRLRVHGTLGLVPVPAPSPDGLPRPSVTPIDVRTRLMQHFGPAAGVT